MRRRVVITGAGVVSAAGNDLERFWQALMAGTCQLKPLEHFTAPGLPNLVGGEATLPPEDDLKESVDAHPERARCLQLALSAARRAMADAQVSRAPSVREAMGVCIGTTLGEERQTGELNERYIQQGVDSVDAGYLLRSDNHRLASVVAEEHGLGGPVMVNATACSSGNAAVSWAYDLVASGAADTMLAGGADALTRLTYCGFSRMGALSKSICRPFHKDRDGVSFGEGAGVLVLEELEHARARGAHIYAELAGFGISNDAYHLTAPEPSGEGFARCIRQALETSGTALDDIDYVSAHGTGTPYNDAGETAAMKVVFGERAPHVPISSIKSMLGHTNGAASAIETVACVLALKHQAIPPTANLDNPDPAFGLDFVPLKGRAARVRACLNLAAGFGGFNVCLVLKEVP